MEQTKSEAAVWFPRLGTNLWPAGAKHYIAVLAKNYHAPEALLDPSVVRSPILVPVDDN